MWIFSAFTAFCESLPALLRTILLGGIASWLALVVHELGHAIAAWTTGVRLWEIRIGIGPTIWAGRIGSCRLRFGLLPILGSVVLLDADAHAIGYRDLRPGFWRFDWTPESWRASVISAAGSVANLAFAIATVLWWRAEGLPGTHTPLGELALYTAVANLGGWLNLLPCFGSDGAHLLAQASAARRGTWPVPVSASRP